MAVGKQQWVIGRAPDCDIVVNDPQVSARHCQLIRTEAGWLLRDLDSTNGTFVNGVRIHGTVTVRPGDRILLANTVPFPWPSLRAESEGAPRLTIPSLRRMSRSPPGRIRFRPRLLQPMRRRFPQ
jgi:pSer/pThr/pTyr-binding forkhead associated (FHA) protein